MRKISYYITRLFAVVLVWSGGVSCKKLVTVPAPYTQQVASEVFGTATSATSAVTVIYAQMINQPTMTYNIPYETGLSGDELANYSTSPDYIAYYTNALSAQTQSVESDIWSPAYNYIYQANAVIQGVTNSSSLSGPVSNQLLGEAKFIRAFWNFYLVNLFGDVPLVVTTDYRITGSQARTSSAQVYQQIVEDLVDAQGGLSTHFVDATDTAVTTERTRPTSWAATALLARVYLYQEDWADAEKEATAVINNSGMFKLVQPLTNVFLANSNEAIWQIQPVVPNTNTPEGAAFILTSAPGSSGMDQSSSLSDTLLHSFEANDNRFTSWVGSVGGYYFPYKYKADGSATSTTEYEMVLRLGEQYLIRAEARAHEGNLPAPGGAVADLNVIRERAGLPDYAGTADSTTVLAAILHERQVELFTEWGHRWLDLKRTRTINTLMGGSAGICAKKGGTWSATSSLYPIPQQDRNADPALTQNQGY